MKIEIRNDRLIAYEEHEEIDYTHINTSGYVRSKIEIVKLDVDAKELAIALKPYLDSIDNCSFKKDDGLDGVNI